MTSETMQALLACELGLTCKCHLDTFCLACKIAGELAQQASTRKGNS